ncbi:MAG: hypothetical protein QMD14_03505, partial [Candidatus Aenigmarchaeota archaeon]|nr:hypothetical protein [Candidatus Aenigmarchaeota archaeon]
MKKAISPMVAVILLIAMVVATSSIVFIWGQELMRLVAKPTEAEAEKVIKLAFEYPKLDYVSGNEVAIASMYKVPQEYTITSFYVDFRELEILNKTSGGYIKLQLNETLAHGKHLFSYYTNTGKLWKEEFQVPRLWLDEAWTQRKGVVIDNTHSMELTNYQVAIDPKLTITEGLVFSAHLGDDGSMVLDYSGKNNDGKLYGNTRFIASLDDGSPLPNVILPDPTKVTDATSYANNGIFYGGNDGSFPSDATQTNETFNCTALDTWLTLAHPEINSGSETVTNMTNSFAKDTDYEIDYPGGRIKCLSTGSMVLNFEYNITYTYSRSPDWVEGKYGKALSFDGVDDYVDVGDKSIFEFPGDFTAEAWIKPASIVDQFRRIMGKQILSTPYGGWFLGLA